MASDKAKESGSPLYFRFFPDNTQDPSQSQSPSLSQVGGKGLSLIQSSQNGFPVPKGFVLSVDFFQPWIELCMDPSKSEAWKIFAEKARLVQQQQRDKETKDGKGSPENDATISKEDCDNLKTACQQMLTVGSDGCYFTPSQETSLQEAIEGVFGGDIHGDGAIVAVRSSSPEEDLVGTSFAGGYETTLGVPLDTSSSGNKSNAVFAKALLTSFLSMLDYRVVQYKLQQQQKLQTKNNNNGNLVMDVLKPKIAVVVQEQIDSQTSGVAFSINPHNNCYDEIVITANFGLGESVVSGIVTPDVYTVERYVDNETKEEAFKVLDQKIGAKQETIWLDKKKDAEKGLAGGTVQTSNQDPSQEAALSEDRILELARMVAKVEDVYSRESSSFCPIDVEWAYHEGTLYLLQARPVTSYIPLFPEMITPRGTSKKNLYLDLVVMTQGFSQPFSPLGMDVWNAMIGEMKPEFKGTGPDCPMWCLHGREYIHISNYLKAAHGPAVIQKGLKLSDPSVGRAIDSVDLDEYTPLEVPSGIRGFLWRTIKNVSRFIPSMIYGWWLGEKAVSSYLEFCEEFITRNEPYMPGASFRSLVMESAVALNENMFFMVGGYINTIWAKYRLGKMFESTSKEKGTDDLLVSLCMDLKGNPTSEMGHAMVRLAGRPEIMDTPTPDEFCRKLSQGGFCEEFMTLYEDFMKRYGCRGMREIDFATPRTSEEPGVFFQKLKQIDPENNAIHRVQERRREAYDKLLDIARELGKESDFVYHEKNIRDFMGYREHPKYMVVAMLALFRERALAIGEEFVREGRMDAKEQIFDLTLDQVALAQGQDAPKDLRPWRESNLRPYKLVEHVRSWPAVIDSRGKIIRGTRKPATEGTTKDDNDSVLLGDPIAPGTTRGRAKVLLEPYEKPLESGEVLVARCTEPSWTPIFINASAVVMEVGGPLQHGAIIAREYGIPCVSGLEDATQRLRDGDLLEVDGSSGTVTILESALDEKRNETNEEPGTLEHSQ